MNDVRQAPPCPALLADILRAVNRRYRVPDIAAAPAPPSSSPAMRLAVAIEQARVAVSHGEAPGPGPKRLFLEALAQAIHQAMRAEAGVPADPMFQAMVMRHRMPKVDEYAALAAQAERDRRDVNGTVNSLTHPRKPLGMDAMKAREELGRLPEYVLASAWSRLRDAVGRLIDNAHRATDASLVSALSRLHDSPGLARLRRLEALSADAAVLQYRALWDQHGPRQGSAMAAAQGLAARQRGAAGEASAARAVQALAQRLNAAEGAGTRYRVATSLRVPGSIPASHARAKTEWDVALLRRVEPNDDTEVFAVCLLVEAKASADAATTDFPRLLRGLRLLSHADADTVYAFETGQGTVRLDGASLRAVPTDEADLADAVLYCCEAADETSPRPLNPASRMQLLSAQASLDFGSAIAAGRHPDIDALEPVWQQLLESPHWRAVLHQHATLRRVRELMVHPEDLLTAISPLSRNAGEGPGVRAVSARPTQPH